LSVCVSPDILRCPCRRKQPLHAAGAEGLRCASADCDKVFPVVDGVPVLINDETSAFRISDFIEHANTTVKTNDTPVRRAGKKLFRYMPDLGANWKAARNLRHLRELLPPRPLLLVVGAGMGDSALERAFPIREVDRVDVDVYFAPRLATIADAHDLPFPDGHFDAVICQSVLEHVADPHRCVAEIHRVLKADGLVYAETPFMQQVHQGGYDFTRFTLGGHRRLFRRFEQIDAGVEGGQAMALAWSIRALFLSLSRSAVNQIFCYFILPFFLFWLKYLDWILIRSPRAADAASELYFLGRKSEATVSDREIIRQYK
jgi:SAM-dependent methyltransferase